MNLRNIKGFTLIELAIVMLIVAILASIAFNILNKSKASDTYAETSAKMKYIAEALKIYKASKGMLPCPASLTDSPSAANFGFGEYSGGNCITATGSTGNPENVVSGAVPVVNLGLPAEYMYDAWGNKFSYIIDSDLADQLNYNANQPNIVITDQNGNSLLARNPTTSEIGGNTESITLTFPCSVNHVDVTLGQFYMADSLEEGTATETAILVFQDKNSAFLGQKIIAATDKINGHDVYSINTPAGTTKIVFKAAPYDNTSDSPPDGALDNSDYSIAAVTYTTDASCPAGTYSENWNTALSGTIGNQQWGSIAVSATDTGGNTTSASISNLPYNGLGVSGTPAGQIHYVQNSDANPITDCSGNSIDTGGVADPKYYAQISECAAFVIISHGPNGFLSFNSRGMQKTSNTFGMAGTGEWENTPNDNMVASFDNKFNDWPHNSQSRENTNATYFDDVLVYRTKTWLDSPY